MGALDLGTGEEEESPPMQGPLSMGGGQPDILSAIALFDRSNSGQNQQPPQQPGQQPPPSSLLDIFRSHVIGNMPPQGAVGQAQQNVMRQQGDPRQKWLQFAAGMMSPTRTGSFGESLGYGLHGLATGMQAEHQTNIALAQKQFDNAMKMEQFGLSGAHLDATLQAINARLNRPSPEAIKAASRADLSGKPRTSPEWQAVFDDEMKKGALLATLTPDLKAHVATLDPDNMTLAQMRKTIQDRQGVLDKRTDEASQMRTNPLFQYGVADPHVFDNLEGEALRSALPPAVLAPVESLLKGNTTVAEWKARNSSAGPLLASFAARIDPNFSTARNKMVNDYKSNKPGSTGNNLTAINTAIGHIGTFSELGEALKNGDFVMGNAVLNRVLTAFGKPAIPDFNLAKEAVATEMMRVFRQVGASDQEVNRWAESFKSSNSPETIQDVSRKAVELLRSRMNAVNEPWKREFHDDFPVLTDHSKEVLGKLEAAWGRTQAPAPGGSWLDRAAAHPKNAGVPRAKLIEEGKKLKKIPAEYNE